MTQRDQSIIAAYSSLGVPVELIAVFTEVRSVFLARLPDEIRAGDDDDNILWRLVQLRDSRKLPPLISENRR